MESTKQTRGFKATLSALNLFGQANNPIQRFEDRLQDLQREEWTIRP